MAKKNNVDEREKTIQVIADMLRTTPFSMEFKVVKRPKGIRIIHEVTQEEMDAIVNYSNEE